MDQYPRLELSMDKLEIINNRAKSENTSLPIDKLKETLGKDRIHRVWNGFEEAAKAQDQGVVIEKIAKHSHVARDIQHLADYLVIRHHGEKEEKKGLLSKWFS
jgi:Flp pilus assembly CpaE family ATPase